jgi:hypothetical protein
MLTRILLGITHNQHEKFASFYLLKNRNERALPVITKATHYSFPFPFSFRFKFSEKLYNNIKMQGLREGRECWF